MKKYIYNMDEDQFAISDGSVIDIHQIEDSNIFELEIFPENQSEDSFESAEHSTSFNMNRFLNDGEIDLSDLIVPDTWDGEDKLYNEFRRDLAVVLGNFKLEDVQTICDNCGKVIDGTVYERENANGYVAEYCKGCFDSKNNKPYVLIIKQEDEEQTEETLLNLPLDVLNDLADFKFDEDSFKRAVWHFDDSVIFNHDFFKLKVVDNEVVKIFK